MVYPFGCPAAAGRSGHDANEFFEETMKISCQACGARYTIADEKVQGKIAKIRCKRCQATIVVNGPGTAAAVDSSSGGAGDVQGVVYTVSVGENDQRTMTVDELVRAYQQGVVNNETYVWAEGMDDWLPLASVPALASAVAARTSLPDGAPPAPETGSVPAARLDGGRVRVDLFGDVDRAGSEDDLRGRAPGAEPDDASSTMTGARNEQSVLFSLQTLGGSSTSTSSGGASADDSGLIDLAALAKAAAEQPPMPMPMAAAAPMQMPMAAPLGAPVLAAPPILGPTMLEAPAMSGSVAPPAKGKTGLYIVIAAALLGTAGVASAIIIALASKPAEPAAGVPVTTGTPVGTTVEAPPPPPPPADTAADAPAASATAPSTAGAATARRPPAGAARPPADKPPATTAAPPAATPAKPPAASNSNCGCPPGDLNCAIKCSATKKK
jgi:predicted Zn finger-like uncharacterized protein